MVFNLVVYFNMTSKMVATTSSFNSAPSFRPPPPPNYRQERNTHDSKITIISHDVTIKDKSETNDVATSTPTRRVPPRPVSEPKRDNLPQPLYISIPNRDISGRCDLGWPTYFAQAEEMCERNPRCKAFVEIEGEAYLKSCTDPDTQAKEGRTLYVHRSYYSRETPNLRASSNLEHKTEKKKDKKPPPPPPHRGTWCLSAKHDNFNCIPQILRVSLTRIALHSRITICITH